MDLPVINKTLIPMVGRTAKMQRLYIGERLKSAGLDLTAEQWFLLARLYREDGLNQNDLASITNRNKASLTRLVNTLEKKNFVARIPSAQDKRVNHIFLTKAGQVLFKQTIPLFHDLLSEMQCGISEEEQQMALNILQKIQNNINHLLK